MRVFLSWSGDPSKLLAEQFRSWINLIIQSVEPWMSEEDIKKGKRWNSELAEELSKNGYGVIFVTRDNVERPWLMYEAGALSKSLEDKVSPLLFGISKSEISQNPLGVFQATDFNQDHMLRLVKSINSELSEPLDETRLERSFKAFWSDFKSSCDRIVSDSLPSAPEKPVRHPDEKEQLALIADAMVDLKRDVHRIEVQQSELLRPRRSALREEDITSAKAVVLQSQKIMSFVSELERELETLKRVSKDPEQVSSIIKLIASISEIREATHRLFDNLYSLSRGVVGPDVLL